MPPNHRGWKSDIFCDINNCRWKGSKWHCNWYRKWSDTERWRECWEHFKVIFYTSQQKRTRYYSLAFIEKRRINEIEIANLRAWKEAEQRLRDGQLEFEQEREETELCQRKDELQQQEDELRLRQHASKLNERELKLTMSESRWKLSWQKEDQEHLRRRQRT